jgi:hypothetical protein
MANLRDKSGKFSTKDTATDTSLTESYQEALRVLQELNQAKAKGKEIDEQERQNQIARVKALKDEIKLRNEVNDITKTSEDDLKVVLSIAGRINKNLQQTTTISKKVGDAFNVMIGFSGEIAKNIKQQNYSTKEGKDAAMATAKAMEKYSDSVSSAMKGFKEGNVDAEQLASIIKQADTGIKEFADSLEDTNPEVIKLKQ